MSFEVVRSPAKVCWWIMVNGTMLCTADTKNEALAQVQKLKRQYT